MAVEQALKAILILYGIEYPKQHDISNLYLNLKTHHVPKWFLVKINSHSKILQILVKKRGDAAYGYVKGITNKDFKEDALIYKEPAQEVINDCDKLIGEFYSNSLK
jgi:HEPN domain-containing protein